ncbi:MAG: DUF4296 domain-containing protein [Bacteroidales bacterium]|nr:DUF4296 domain-containing protein [Bacteroidales bacterium]
MKFSANIYLLAILFALVSCSVACSGRKNKAEHRDIIPERDLVAILADLHIADGLLSIPRINNLYANIDSLAAHVNVIEKHGYTKEAMDRTMRFYFIKRPKELIRIYDKVLGKLSAMESRLLQFNPTLNDISSNYWQGEPFYFFSGETATDTSGINMVVLYSRFYTLNFTITVYPDDETIDPRMNLFFEATGPAKGTINRTYFPEIKYLKDGQPHSYSIPVRIKEMPPIRIKGWFVNQENQYPGLKKHYFVENISLNPRLPGQ